MPSYSDGEPTTEVWNLACGQNVDGRSILLCIYIFFFAFNHYCYRTTDYGITPWTVRYRRNKHDWERRGGFVSFRFIPRFGAAKSRLLDVWTCEIRYNITFEKTLLFFVIYIFSRRRSRFRADASLIAILLTHARSNRWRCLKKRPSVRQLINN